MRTGVVAVLGLAAVAGCATPPVGPLVQVFPGRGKTSDQFASDQFACARFASMATDGEVAAVNNQAAGGAVLSTIVGTGLGAIVGGGRGAAVGAVTGAGLGTGLGAASSASTQGAIQYHYDAAYAQCMVAQGNVVPGYVPAVAYQAPPPLAYQPPPPVAYQAAPPPVAYQAAPPPDGSELVRAVQYELTRLGYVPIAIDGVAGPQTVNAIESFQQAHGLPIDGVPTPGLLAQLRQISTSY